jgi:hypothetical protein
MENGVKIIIERLKTNPEEFVARGNKWMQLVMQYKEYLSEYDRELLLDALRPVLVERFNEDVLKTLVNYDEIDPQGDLFDTSTLKVNSNEATIKVRKPTKFGKLFNYT